MKILLVEDNQRNAYLMRFILEHAGYGVEHAVDGPSALEQVEQGRYSLVILDIQLPGMDGYSLAGHLRAHPRASRLPIIAVTSHAMAGDRERALSAGCHGYVEKPINPDSFVEEIRAILSEGTAPSLNA